ncbi:MAG: hypothetical protein ACTJLL_02655, partial [Anaplasma sp.]
MLEEDQGEIEVHSSQDADPWGKYAELDDKEMNEGLETAKGLVEAARKAVDTDLDQEKVKSSVGTVQRTFESFFTGMTDRLTNLSTTFGNCADEVLEVISTQLSTDDADKFRAEADKAKTETQAAVIKGCGSAVVAQGSIRNEIKKLLGAVEGKDAAVVKDLLTKFEERAVKAAESAMKEIKAAREAVKDLANKFIGSVGQEEAVKSLEKSPQAQLMTFIAKLEEELKTEPEVSIKEELDRVKAVMRQADKE